MSIKPIKLFFAITGCMVTFISFHSAAVAAEKTLITVGTAPAGSASFPFVIGVSTLVNKHNPNLALSPQEGGGGVSSIRLLDEGKTQIGGFSATTAVSAIEGQAPFKKKRNVVILMTTYQQTYIYFAPKKTGVKSWDDVAGKKVLVGTPGGSTRVVGTLLAKLKGMDTKATLMWLRPGAMLSAVRDGNADTGYGLLTGVSMAPWLTEALSTMDVNVYGADDATIAKAGEMKPGLIRVDVPEGWVKGRAAFSSVGEALHLGSSPSLPDEIAYAIVKTVYENYERMWKFSSAVKGQKREKMVTGIPEKVAIHPGALRFYKEVGLLK